MVLLQVSRGFVDRNVITGMSLVAKQDQYMDIFVENQGRINFGSDILNNTKVGFKCISICKLQQDTKLTIIRLHSNCEKCNA